MMLKFKIEAIMDFSQIPVLAFKFTVVRYATVAANATTVTKGKGSFRLAKAILELRTEESIESRISF